MTHKQQIILGYEGGKSQRQIARELGISRSTVFTYIQVYRKERKQLVQGSVPSTLVSAPRYDSGRRVGRRLTQEVSGLIDKYISVNAAKRRQGLSKQCLKGVDIHAALLRAGHKIAYSTVSGYLRQQARRPKEAYIRQQPDLGETAEFDWGVVRLSINGQRVVYQLAIFTLCYSNYRWARLFDRQDMSSFLQAHVAYFSHVGGVAGEVVYDNLRTGVAKYSHKPSDKQPTEDLLKLSVYYGFKIRFCNARRGNEKGRVERSVEYIRRKAFAIEDCFTCRAQANAHLLKVLEHLNQGQVATEQQTIIQRYQRESTQLRLIPPMPFDVGQPRRAKVDKYACIKVDTNYYSVPDKWVGERLDIKIYPDYILVYDTHNQLIARHERRRSRFKYYIELGHYLHTLSQKPGALKGSVGLKQADGRLRAVFHQHFVHRPKTFIELLLFIQQQGLDNKALLLAIEKTKTCTPHQAPCADKIKYFLTHTAGQAAKPAADSPLATQIQDQCQQQLVAIQAMLGQTNQPTATPSC